MRLCVCGGRTFGAAQGERLKVYTTLAEIHATTPISVLINGGATGADEVARRWADLNGVECFTFTANWRVYGRAAGPTRNGRMLNEGKPDLVVAFKGGRGTADCVRQARAKGIKVREIA